MNLQLYHQNRNRGFTLLEVLVAVVIMAVIMTTAFGALRLGSRSWEAGITHASGNETFRTVADLLRRQVAQVIPMTWVDDTQQRIAFEGTAEQLRFIAPAPQQYRQAGLFEYGIAAQRQGLATSLVLSYAPYNPESREFQVTANQQQVQLVEGLQHVSFDYFGSSTRHGSSAENRGEAPRWYPRWDISSQEYPNLIRVRMEVSEGQQPWPDLYLALPVGRKQ